MHSTLHGPIQHITSAPWLWLIPLFPLLGAIINAFFGQRLQKANQANVHFVAIGAMAASFLVAVTHFVMLVGAEGRFLYGHVWSMFRIGQLDVDFAFAMDELSGLMTLIITGIGTLIHVYSAGYMSKEPAYWRFFCYLNLFVFSMLLLVLGENFMVMFFGWEGVGLCSYLLIGFWYRDYGKATAGMKAFVVNRVGDWGFVSGLMILFWGLGGAWVAEGYTRDDSPRIAAVTAEAMPAQPSHGEQGEHEGAHAAAAAPRTLTVTVYPGADVYVQREEGEPQHIGRSPVVRHALEPGEVTVLVDVPGTIGRLETRATIGDHETALVVLGPTTSFRTLRDQLTLKVDRLANDESGAAGGTTELRDVLANKKIWGIGLLTLACLGFFIGATGKSAQIPLYTWLPDAMAGPTPVSALIHAATMVTAGVYMVARLSFLFSMSPTAMTVVTAVGAMTALFAATMGFFQYDIKKVLAYSTVSQLGFMFIGVGSGAYWVGIFHLMTHAFFKANLFLCSGSVIHGMHHVHHDEASSQDMRNMGGLQKVMPKTAMCYLLGTIAITAVPPGAAGFWSKDEILWKVFTSETIWGGPIWYVLGLCAAACTSFYMWRSWYMTFSGEPSETIKAKVHESPASMTVVLQILAALSIIGGLIGAAPVFHHLLHVAPPLEQWLFGPTMAFSRATFPEHSPIALELGLMALSIALAAGSWLLARSLYANNANPARLAAIKARHAGVWRVLHNKYYVDEIYQATIVNGVRKLRIVLADFDKYAVDGFVNGAGVFGKTASKIVGLVDQHGVDGLVNGVADGTLQAGRKLRGLQTGRIQNYVYGIVGGVAILAFLQYLVK
ncbi:MAG: NADH-quinone oxidoreductase subunit L [Deltaproteobacteria bacterium]|nr:NADH-quinone oxidoreductase subunit L [Deltaproteobacteria bacterium]